MLGIYADEIFYFVFIKQKNQKGIKKVVITIIFDLFHSFFKLIKFNLLWNFKKEPMLVAFVLINPLFNVYK